MEKARLTINISNNELEDYRKELYNQILNDPDYNELLKQGFSNEEIYKNVTKFLEYLDDLKLSRVIKTYNDCKKFNKFERIILVRNGKIIERSYLPLKPYQDHLDLMSKFVEKDIPEGDEEADYLSLPKELKKQISMKIKNNKWVYLYGNVRSGRSYAAASLINRKYKDLANTIAYINCPKRFKQLADLYFKDTGYFNEIIKAYSEADFLVFDDFGSEFKNGLIRDSILIPILKNRINNKKVTCFTSDFKIDVVCEMYHFKNETSDQMLIQVIRLLKENTGSEVLTSELSLY